MKTLVLFAALVTVCVYYAANVTQSVPVVTVEPLPIIPIERPKQSPYVLYVHVCNKLELIMSATNPPLIADHDTEAPPELIKFMIAANQSGRVVVFQSDPRRCPKTIPDRPKKKV